MVGDEQAFKLKASTNFFARYFFTVNECLCHYWMFLKFSVISDGFRLEFPKFGIYVGILEKFLLEQKSENATKIEHIEGKFWKMTIHVADITINDNETVTISKVKHLKAATSGSNMPISKTDSSTSQKYLLASPQQEVIRIIPQYGCQIILYLPRARPD